jgi:cytochrome c biogenesis protein CcmG/thiol:disulfide interchange protein DsbE
MPFKTAFRSATLHILAGFVALCVLFAYVVVYSRNDLALFVLVTAVLFFLAGILRGARAPKNSWLAGLLIGLGGVMPVVVMRVTGTAMTEQGYLPLFIVFSLLLAIAGVETRHLLFRGRRRAASFLALLSFGAAILVMTTAIPSLMARWSSELVNRPTPSFSFVTLDGKPVTSTDLRGRVVILAFWTTWCLPCRQELPELQEVYEQYERNSNVAFYAVGGPWGNDTAEKESAFAKQMRLNMPLAFDSHGTAQALGVRTFPALIILDGGGRIRLVHSGYDASEQLARHVSKEVGTLVGK